MATSKNSHVHVLSETIRNTLEDNEKEKTENTVKVGKIAFLCNHSPRNFHIPKK